MSRYFQKNGTKKDDHGHEEHHEHKHVSTEEAKAASTLVNSSIAGTLHNRAGLYRVTPLLSVLTSPQAEKIFQHWTSDEIKTDVLQCAKELNRFRYCEDNYSAESSDPAEDVENEEYACTEEQWQATECLTNESPDAALDILAFARDVNNAAQLLRRLSSHIQIPREWKEVVDEVDPSGLTAPGKAGPTSMIKTYQTEKLTNSIMKTLFVQEVMDYSRACSKSEVSKECRRAKTLLSQSWMALQTSRYNARGQRVNFSDVDTSKGNKIKKWKKANVVGGDKSLRRIEVHPADNWINTLDRKGSQYDWLPEIVASIEKSLKVGSEEEPQGDDQQ